MVRSFRGNIEAFLCLFIPNLKLFIEITLSCQPGYLNSKPK